VDIRPSNTKEDKVKFNIIHIKTSNDDVDTMKTDNKKIKEINRDYRTTVRWNHDEAIQVQLRAGALGMTRGEYIRAKSLEPINKLIKAQESKSIDREAIAVLASIRNELSRQGNNLNQIARAANLAKLEGKPMDGYLKTIDEIKDINREIMNSIANLRAN
jgi:Bacterial mobilisation protein (MobC)